MGVMFPLLLLREPVPTEVFTERGVRMPLYGFGFPPFEEKCETGTFEELPLLL